MSFDHTSEIPFDHIVRENSHFLKEFFGKEQLLPFWVADTGYPPPEEITFALKQRIEQGLFSYEVHPESLFDAFIMWFETRHQLSIKREEIVASGSVMNSVALLISLLSEKGEGVIIQPPVYMTFQKTINDLERKVENNTLIYEYGSYHIGFEELEELVAQPENKILLLCSPHNPVGRVWSLDELNKMVALCQKHNVFVISDEIHADLILPEEHFDSILKIKAELRSNVAMVYSIAKSFNVMSISEGFVVLPDASKREQLQKRLEAFHLNHANAFSTIATESAFRYGQDYIDELMSYVDGNIWYVKNFLEQELPMVKTVVQQGTYLMWLNFREYDIPEKSIAEMLTQNANLALNPGSWFGEAGEGFFRFNVACPRSILETAMDNMKNALP